MKNLITKQESINRRINLFDVSFKCYVNFNPDTNQLIGLWRYISEENLPPNPPDAPADDLAAITDRLCHVMDDYLVSALDSRKVQPHRLTEVEPVVPPFKDKLLTSLATVFNDFPEDELRIAADAAPTDLRRALYLQAIFGRGHVKEVEDRHKRYVREHKFFHEYMARKVPTLA